MELKTYINKILGDNIRCILPSYWWKRIFGLILDKIDEVSKSIGNATPDMSNVQEKLVSGVNIKTVNNQSILGSGNLQISNTDNYIDYSTIKNSKSQILQLITRVRNGEMPKLFYYYNGDIKIATRFLIIDELNTFLIWFGEDSKTYGYDLDTGASNVEKYLTKNIVITTNDSRYLTRNKIISYLIRKDGFEFTYSLVPVSYNEIYTPISARNNKFTILENGVVTIYVLNPDGTVTKQS